MKTTRVNIPQTDERSGFVAAVIAYFIWGFLPVYFILIQTVPAIEILAHRIMWSVPFGLLIIVLRRQIGETLRALKSPKILGLLLISALAIAANWGIYIWAVQQGQIFQGSLGYYITPLIYVLIGVVFYNEDLSGLKGLAVLLAILGVLVLAIYGGVIPYISFALAITFTIYGVIRKRVDVGAMPGLLIETVLILPPALIYLAWLARSGALHFGPDQLVLSGRLMLAGPITVLPLVAFAFAAKKLRFTSIGFLQFIGPTLQFFCGLYFGETFTLAHAWCFGLIWLAVIVFSVDALRGRKPA